MNKIHIVIISMLILSSCTPPTPNNWQIAYKSNKEGQTIQGSKSNLVQAIRSGASVRIGWGWKGEERSIEHLSDSIWLAVLNEQEVLAHLDPQVLSVINWDNLNADYSDSTRLSHEWRVVITTKGDFDAIWYDRKTHEQIRRIPQNHTMTWFVKDASKGSVPLFSE